MASIYAPAFSMPLCHVCSIGSKVNISAMIFIYPANFQLVLKSELLTLACKKLFDLRWWNLATEGAAWSKVRQKWMEHDKLHVWVYTERKEENTEVREFLGLEPVKLGD